mgnify:CR=1 FL=1
MPASLREKQIAFLVVGVMMVVLFDDTLQSLIKTQDVPVIGVLVCGAVHVVGPVLGIVPVVATGNPGMDIREDHNVDVASGNLGVGTRF